MSQQQCRIIIAGGGTGGHVFPAIAIARALKKIAPASEILFVGAIGKMEMEKVPAAGFQIEGLPVAGIQRRITWKNLLVPFKLLNSLNKAREIINSFKPNIVVGVGGYASGPVGRVAQRKQIPLLLQEQNSFPGLTNKILAKKAKKICVAYPGMEKYFPAEKILITGNPVRPEIKHTSDKRQQALEFFKLSEEKPVLLVIGGSLGARSINEAVKRWLQMFVNAGIQVLWQTGKTYANDAMQITNPYKENGVFAMQFIERMDYAYAAADIIVSRAGAIAVSELCLVRKPVILVPSPNVAEDHQTKNAMALVKANAALMLRDSEVSALLGETVIELIANDELKIGLSNEIAKLAFENADETIAYEILKLVR